MNVLKAIFLCTILLLSGCAQPNKELNNTVGLEVLVKAYQEEVTKLLNRASKYTADRGNKEKHLLLLDTLNAFHAQFLPCYSILDSSIGTASEVLMDSLVLCLPNLREIGVEEEVFRQLRQDSLQFLKLNGQRLELNREEIPVSYLPLYRILVQLELLDIEQRLLESKGELLIRLKYGEVGTLQPFVVGDRNRVKEQMPYRSTIEVAEVLNSDHDFIIDGIAYKPNENGTTDLRFYPKKAGCIDVRYALAFKGENRVFESKKCYHIFKSNR